MATAALEIPSSDRGIPGSHLIVPAKFPEASPEPLEPIDPQRVVTVWLDAFNHLLRGQEDSTGKLFLAESYWRDLLCSTWDFHTFQGPSKISSVLKTGHKPCRLRELKLDSNSDFKKPALSSADYNGTIKAVQAFLTVETDIGRGRGLVKLVPDTKDGGAWKAFTLFTTLEELKGHEESTCTRRPTGVDHGAHPGRLNWQQMRDAEANCETPFEPAVLIVGTYLHGIFGKTCSQRQGAGQGGLTVAARLKQLGVRALVFTPKDKLAEWFETYAKALELNVWTKTNLTASSWDDSKHQWTVTLEREIDGTFYPRHIVQATGHSGEPYFPSHIKGLDDFKGDRLVHSSQFTGPQPNGKGKKAVIVGSCNSAHGNADAELYQDIAQDYYEYGYDVTMVQRSSTLVVQCDTLIDVDMKGTYSEDGPSANEGQTSKPPVEDADIDNFAKPNPVLARYKTESTRALNALDAPILLALQRAGFALDNGPSSAGIFMKYLHRGGGYYIDVGCSSLIASGQIKIKQGVNIARVNPHSVSFDDGSEVDADEIVFATGYQSMKETARVIFGDQVAGRVGDVWGFDAEGEVRGMWRRSGCEGFWFVGGNLALCRFFSRLLALQIKGLEVGLMNYGDD
ncbi:MAG: hypothetical protein Q9211_006028 [Gyalolechia sp. 1 TL-2023]